MSNTDVFDFYDSLDFEEAEVEDQLTAFFFEVSPEGNYALITDEDGAMPKSLKQPIIFACYTPEGSFLWSASFKNSHLFKDLWSSEQSPEDKMEAIRKHRKNNDEIN